MPHDDWRTHPVIAAGVFELDDIAILQSALDQAWEFVPPKRRTRANREALAADIVRLAAYSKSDPGLLSVRALSRLIPEVPYDPL
jgi:hypothetical protein